MALFLGIDCGTQSTKAVIYDTDKKEITAQASSPHELISRNDGTREQQADWWVMALKKALSEIDVKLKSNLSAVGVSGQQHGFVPLSETGEVLYNVKLWCDTVTVRECTEITERFGGRDKLLSEVGNLILPGYTASKVIWLKNHHPDIYQKLACILLPHDYLNYYLTGEKTMECGDASGTGFLNIRERKWDEALLKAADPERDLRSLLPEIIDASAPAGYVTSSVAAELGIPAGIPVSAGGGDNMMGALGTGAVTPGIVTMSMGTSGTFYGYADQPVIDKQGRLAAFCSSSNGWLPLLCTMNCTVATELTRGYLDIDLPAVAETAARAPLGSAGIITLPFYNGERTPDLPGGRGCVVGMTAGNVTRENLLRSSMEAAVFGMKAGLEAFLESGFSPAEIRLIGGGSKNPLWRQICADVLGLPVVIPVFEEAAAMGAALQSIWCSEHAAGRKSDLGALAAEHLQLDPEKECTPVKENTAAYTKVYADYSRYLKALAPLFK